MKTLRLFNAYTLLMGATIIYGCKSQQSTTLSSTESQFQADSVTRYSEATYTELLEEANTRLVLNTFSMQKEVENILEKSHIFSSHFTGFSLFDISKNDFIVNYNANKHFTPASNVKILTLYASLRSFGQKLPGMMYRETSDTLFLRPVGDPTLLHQFFANQPVIEKIKESQKPIAIEWPDSNISPFGIGWMWDDYSYGFQPELSWMPIHGNVVHFEYDKAKLVVTPSLFNDLVEVSKERGESNSIQRALNHNYFEAEIQCSDCAFEKNIPFKYSKSLATKLLHDAVQLPVRIIPESKLKMDTLYSQSIDTVLRRMMQKSDNFIAEQLLIMAAWENGFLDSKEFREFMVTDWLPEIAPVWVDGSGISRYNLIRPIDEVLLLKKLYVEFGWARIYSLFSKGGESGTIKDWYLNESNLEEPYIIAKTGSLLNNHTLSGYLKTQSGKLLIFSFMNNNYVKESVEVKKAMQLLLKGIRDAY